MIDLHDIEFGWTPTTRLLAIDEFHVGRGERVFIEGPSGSGKSTLLGLIGGVLEARRGAIRIDGTDLTGQGRAARDRFRADRIGYIFQMFNLIPYLSVLENVCLPARFSARRARQAAADAGSIEHEARRLLDALGFEESAALHARQVTQLSHGQQQRVAAARALFGKPQVLIADEPTSSLDAGARERFLTLLMQECRQAGTTLLFVSHDTALSSLFDRSVALHEINRGEARREP